MHRACRGNFPEAGSATSADLKQPRQPGRRHWRIGLNRGTTSHALAWARGRSFGQFQRRATLQTLIGARVGAPSKTAHRHERAIHALNTDTADM